MVGRTGYTPPNAGMSPNGPAQMTAIYEHFDSKVGESVALISSLPASGNWTGRTIAVEQDKTIRTWFGSSWVIVGGLPSTGAVAAVSGFQINSDTKVYRDPTGWVYGYLSVTRTDGAALPSAAPFAVVGAGYRPTATWDGPSVVSQGGAGGSRIAQIGTNGNVVVYDPGAGNVKFAMPFGYQGA